jgi:hypothetical protein
MRFRGSEKFTYCNNIYVDVLINHASRLFYSAWTTFCIAHSEEFYWYSVFGSQRRACMKLFEFSDYRSTLSNYFVLRLTQTLKMVKITVAPLLFCLYSAQ